MLNPVSYIQEVASELKKVSWPSREQTINMTALVVVVCIGVALYLTGVDFILNKLVTTVISQ